jgi:hypothetical protein
MLARVHDALASTPLPLQADAVAWSNHLEPAAATAAARLGADRVRGWAIPHTSTACDDRSCMVTTGTTTWCSTETGSPRYSFWGSWPSTLALTTWPCRSGSASSNQGTTCGLTGSPPGAGNGGRLRRIQPTPVRGGGAERASPGHRAPARMVDRTMASGPRQARRDGTRVGSRPGAHRRPGRSRRSGPLAARAATGEPIVAGERASTTHPTVRGAHALQRRLRQ